MRKPTPYTPNNLYTYGSNLVLQSEVRADVDDLSWLDCYGSLLTEGCYQTAGVCVDDLPPPPPPPDAAAPPPPHAPTPPPPC